MTHCVRDTAYETFEDLRAHFRELWKSGVLELSINYRVCRRADLDAILEAALEYEISIVQVRISGAEVLGGAAGDSALERLYTPDDSLFLRWMPIKCIVFCSRIDCEADYSEQLLNILDHTRRIQDLKASYHLTLKAELTFSFLNGMLLSDLTQQLINTGVSTVNLQFSYPLPSFESVALLKRELALFHLQPIARHPAIRFAKLPFCFLPAPYFRPLYRALYEEIPDPSQFQLQRVLIRKIRGAKNGYHKPCESCRRRAACYAATPIERNIQYVEHLTPNVERTVAFVGASLTAQDIHAYGHDVVFTAPAQQGDGLMAVLEGFSTILLFDGYFFQRYALTTFEILTALVENVNVFGSSSLGAIRGLELENYGMRVDGYVYRFLRARKLVPYHVVAQTYDENDRPATEALISIYRLLEVAYESGAIGDRTRETCYAIAEGVHFSQLTYARAFEEWEASSSVSPEEVGRIRDLLADQGVAPFDVKRQDALSLLKSFSDVVTRDGPYHTVRAVVRAREKYITLLRAKYKDDCDSSLSPNWKTPSGKGGTSRRERPLASTIQLAEKFFEDLDVVVADTSMLDRTHYFMISVVFVPYYFLDYGNSASSGYGESLQEALVSAYGEVLERIPAGTLRTRFVDCTQVQSPIFPFGLLPFYQTMDERTKAFFIKSDGTLKDTDYIECTEILSARKFALPKNGARGPSSLGMAAGNTMLEAILYGLYEVLEHDVSAVWQTNALVRELRHVNVDMSCIQDVALKQLVADQLDKGHRVHFFNLINPYNVPTVLSAFYEADRQLVFTGIACRLDPQDAMTHSFHEALNGHFVSYFGSRDDRRGFEQQSSAEPARFLEHFLGAPKVFSMERREPGSPSEQLEELLKKLRQAGAEHVFAIDLSPREQYQLAAAKVVVPGMYRRRGVSRTMDFYRKCLEIRRLVSHVATGDFPVDDGDWPLSRLQREFGRPIQRFFKA